MLADLRLDVDEWGTFSEAYVPGRLVLADRGDRTGLTYANARLHLFPDAQLLTHATVTADSLLPHEAVTFDRVLLQLMWFQGFHFERHEGAPEWAVHRFAEQEPRLPG